MDVRDLVLGTVEGSKAAETEVASANKDSLGVARLLKAIKETDNDVIVPQASVENLALVKSVADKLNDDNGGGDLRESFREIEYALVESPDIHTLILSSLVTNDLHGLILFGMLLQKEVDGNKK